MTARLTDAQVFVPRYYIWGVPGLALLTAVALSGLSNPSARRLVGSATVVVLCARPFPSGASAHGGEDWRGALQAAAAVTERSRAPLLLCSGFPEEIIGRAEEPATLDNPLTTPLAMYPVHTDVFLGPNNLEETGRKRLETIVSRVLLARGTFVLVSRLNAEPIDIWLRGRFAGEPYTVRSLGEFPGITTLIFERSGPSASVR